METVELIDQTARVLRLLQRELQDIIDASDLGETDDSVTKCQAASNAINILVPALREARATQESQDLLNPSPPCPDYDAF
jgi:hypothetical protein